MSNGTVTLGELQENVEQLFELVKRQAQLARAGRDDGRGDLDETERSVYKGLQALGVKLMAQYFRELGQGDVGYRARFDGQEYRRAHRDRASWILTIFGKVHYQQSIYYGANGNSVRPLAAMANLPERRSSYFVQDLMARLGIEQTYANGQEFYADFFGHSPSPRTLEVVVADMAEICSKHGLGEEKQPLADEGQIGVVSFDGKGVPVVAEERTTGKTREALLGCHYTVEPQDRTAEQIAYSMVLPIMLEDEDREHLHSQAGIRATDIRYCGSVQCAKREIFEKVQQAAQARFAAAGVTEVACLLDGAPTLWRLAKEFFPDAVRILDLIHVIGYLWDAANALESDYNKARVLVCAYLRAILQGRVGPVIGGLRSRLTRRRLRGNKRKAIEKAITYFDNHRDGMQYHDYLAKGLPIASGVIESACGHIVKERLDKAGAQWRLAGAEAVIHLRCVKANGHWHDYQKARKEIERKRLYASLMQQAA